MAVNSILSVGISQSSDFTPQSYPIEPLDSNDTNSLAAIRADLPRLRGENVFIFAGK